MISLLTGRIVHTDPRFVVVSVNGVGYKVYTTSLPKEEAGLVTFWTYLAVRENALDLYGFLTKDDLDIFEMLLTVSGIGPKTAATILAVANPSIIRKAVINENADYLVKTSGIGRKNAEKIVLELKNKLVGETSNIDGGGEADALDALKALGIRERDARDALKKVPEDITDVGERVKYALKAFGTK